MRTAEGEERKRYPTKSEASGGFFTMKLRHYDNDGRARFVTFCTHRRLPLLTNRSFRGIVVKSIDEVRSVHGFALLGYVIMPEHVYLVLWPPEVMDVGRVVGEIKRRSAIEMLSVLSRAESQVLDRLAVRRDSIERRVIWQRRCYDHNCRSESSVWEKAEYCHQNPVKRGLVRNAGS